MKMKCPVCEGDEFGLSMIITPEGRNYARALHCERCNWSKYVPSLPVKEIIEAYRLEFSR